MAFRHFKPLLGGLSLVFIGFLVMLDQENVSPGPLSAAHRNVAELRAQDCDRCHGDSKRTLAQACNDCHGQIAQQLALKGGFHGQLPKAEDCGKCHTEHFGTELALVSERSFTQAGIKAIADYTHAGLDFELVGRHGEISCQECHPNANARTLPKGQPRFLGLSQDCATCHQDPHAGRMAKDCNACHGQERPFHELANFLHPEGFPLDGVHGESACTDCHEPEGAFAVELLGGLQSPQAPQCADCHDSPHSQPFLHSVSAQLALDVAASCAACHSEHGTLQPFASYNVALSRELHGASGFELQAPHAEQACVDCHNPQSQPERLPNDCGACHAGPHGDQFLGGPFRGSDCLTCHAPSHFTPSIFNAQTHLPTGFELEAGHGQAGCADCHQVPSGQALGLTDFSAVENACSACHVDVHRGQFLGLASEPEACDICHQTTTFADLDRDAFDHGRRTGFELAGAHRSARCESCHQPAQEADSFGRRFGRVLASPGVQASACINCHDNVHVGPMANSSESCDQCHNTQGFEQVDRDRFDHQARTGFELAAAHARAACETCHVPAAVPDESGRGFGFASTIAREDPARCSACHSDPHKGRFRGARTQDSVAPSPECSACHNQDSFLAGSRETFDHGLWSAFPLEAAHAQARCEDCHSKELGGSLGASRGSRCSDCHADAHHGQLGSTGCARCHSSTRSFLEVTFDHRFDSQFALDAIHADLACASCHQPWPLATGGSAIRYKPLGTQCVDCHQAEKAK